MKKIIVFLMSLLLVLSLCACQPSQTNSSSKTGVETLVTDATTPSEDGTTATDSSIVYDGFVITEDYEGKPALIVFMTWTNVTEDTTMFATEYSIDAFQAGIGLDSLCVIMNDEYTDALNATITEIRPGATIEVAQSFLLKDTTSKIEIEVDEWISFDDEIISFIEIDPTAIG